MHYSVLQSGRQGLYRLKSANQVLTALFLAHECLWYKEEMPCTSNALPADWASNYHNVIASQSTWAGVDTFIPCMSARNDDPQIKQGKKEMIVRSQGECRLHYSCSREASRPSQLALSKTPRPLSSSLVMLLTLCHIQLGDVANKWIP